MKTAAKGTKLQLSIASVFTTVAYITEIDGPDPEVQFKDVTDLNSGVSLEDGEPTGHTAPGEVSFKGWYDPQATTHQACLAQITNPIANGKANWKVVYPDPDLSETPFVGTCKQFKTGGKQNDFLTVDGSIKLAGLPTFPEPEDP